jgi:plasmid stability protein
MASILIENIPEALHERLKKEAARNQRSMPQQALAILESALPNSMQVKLPEPITPRRPFTQEWLSQAIREGRE